MGIVSCWPREHHIMTSDENAVIPVLCTNNNLSFSFLVDAVCFKQQHGKHPVLEIIILYEMHHFRVAY